MWSSFVFVMLGELALHAAIAATETGTCRTLAVCLDVQHHGISVHACGFADCQLMQPHAVRAQLRRSYQRTTTHAPHNHKQQLRFSAHAGDLRWMYTTDP